MPAYLYTAPTAGEPVTLAEAKTQLNLEHALDDVFVAALIVAARLHVEEACWRGLVTQVWELVEPRFPGESDSCLSPQQYAREVSNGFELPRGNLVSVASVKYLDGAGTQQTLVANTDYLVDTVNCPGRVRLAYGMAWPTHRAQWDAVRIRYTVGWAVADVPMPLKQAILLLVSDMYEHRTPEVQGSPAADALMRPYRLVRHT